MTNLHDHLLSIVKANQGDNNVKQNTTPSPDRFRLSPATLGITLSDELLAQLDRYCAANLVIPKSKPDAQPKPMARSQAVRKAVYALMENPSLLYGTPKRLPTIGLPPARPNNVSWTMPQNKPADIRHLHDLCAHHGLKQFFFTRRAIYLYTADHKSLDTSEADTAARDAWF